MELSGSCEEFPVDLDAIWRIGYRRKDIAVRALRNEFVEGEDYIEKVFAKDVENQRFRRNAESVTGGDLKSVRYYLSVSCAEYLIVRKCRAVFEVYRRVFHHVLGAGRDVAGMGRYYSMEEYCRMFGKGRMSLLRFDVGLPGRVRDVGLRVVCVAPFVPYDRVAAAGGGRKGIDTQTGQGNSGAGWRGGIGVQSRVRPGANGFYGHKIA